MIGESYCRLVDADQRDGYCRKALLFQCIAVFLCAGLLVWQVIPVYLILVNLLENITEIYNFCLLLDGPTEIAYHSLV